MQIQELNDNFKILHQTETKINMSIYSFLLFNSNPNVEHICPQIWFMVASDKTYLYPKNVFMFVNLTMKQKNQGKHELLSIINIWIGNVSSVKNKFEKARAPLKGLYRKNERGYRLKANQFSSRSRPMKVISDVTFLSREIDIDPCQNTKINIYTILYKSSGFK